MIGGGLVELETLTAAFSSCSFLFRAKRAKYTNLFFHFSFRAAISELSLVYSND